METEPYRLTPSFSTLARMRKLGLSPETMVADDYVQLLRSRDGMSYRTHLNRDETSTLTAFLDDQRVKEVRCKGESENIPLMLVMLIESEFIKWPQ